MYDYNNGRFLSVDPFITGTSTQSLNPYTYIFNNPLSGRDPSGYIPCKGGVKDECGSPAPKKENKKERRKGRGLSGDWRTVYQRNNGISSQLTSEDKKDISSIGSVNHVEVAAPAEQISRIIDKRGDFDGTYFFGGAGLTGNYIPDMVLALQEAGISDVHSVPREYWSGGTIADAVFGVLALNEEINLTQNQLNNLNEKFLSQGDGKGQFNLIGYSYGSLVAAQISDTRVKKGGFVDNLVLIGSPIDKSFLNSLNQNPNIGRVHVINLSEQGDLIYAGISGGELSIYALSIGVQMVRGKGHFYYSQETKEGNTRRRELGKDIRKRGIK